MKKLILFICLFFINMMIIEGNEKIIVSLSQCVDGDTAKLLINNEEVTIRMLALDTPETKHPTVKEEPWGKEASEYTCNILSKGNIIEIEYDINSNKEDKYGRHLVWVFVDDYLLQDLIIKKGYGEVAYLYGEYKYVDILKRHQAIAEEQKIGIWSNSIPKEKENLVIFILSIILFILIFIFNTKYQKKIIRKILKLKI